MNTPAPQSSLGHSRRRRVIFPFRVIDLVEFEYRKLDLLLLVLGLLGNGVILLLPFLSTTTQTEHQVKGGMQVVARGRQGEGKGWLIMLLAPS